MSSSSEERDNIIDGYLVLVKWALKNNPKASYAQVRHFLIKDNPGFNKDYAFNKFLPVAYVIAINTIE